MLPGWGLAVDHLLRPGQSFTYSEFSVPVQYSLYGGSKVITKQNLQLYYQEVELLIIGVWCRGLPVFNNVTYTNHDALVFKVGAQLDFIGFGFGYDFTVSGLQSATGGANEISFTYLFNQYQTYKKRITGLPCHKICTKTDFSMYYILLKFT